MAPRDAYRHLNGSFYSRQREVWHEAVFGSIRWIYSPLEVANTGLAWDSVQKTSTVILLMTGIVGGGISNVNVIPWSPFAHYF